MIRRLTVISQVKPFRVYRHQLIRPIQTRFRFGYAAERLNLADDGVPFA